MPRILFFRRVLEWVNMRHRRWEQRVASCGYSWAAGILLRAKHAEDIEAYLVAREQHGGTPFDCGVKQALRDWTSLGS